MFFLKYVDSKKQFEVTIRKFDSIAVITIAGRIDLSIFKEIFLEDEYDFNLPSDASCILDIGANVGYASIFFTLKYRDAKVYAFEPDPANYLKLKRNVEKYSNISIYKYAVGGGDMGKEIIFYVNSKSGAGSSFMKRNDTDVPVTVVTKTMKDLLKELGVHSVDILKFDVEGAEEQIFMGKDFPYESVQHIIGEVHEDLVKVCIKDFYKKISNRYILEKRDLQVKEF